MIAAALERGIEVVGELELAWRAIPNRFVAVTGTNGKTTTVELLGHLYRTAGEPVAVAGNVGTPLSALAGEIEPDATVVCEAPASSSRTASPSRPSARSSSTSPPTTSTATPTSTPTWRRSCGSSPTRATTTSPSTTPTTRRWPASTSAAARAGSPSAAAPAPDCEVSPSEGTIFYDGEPLLAVDELGLFGEHNVANAMAAAAAALSMGLDRDAVREGLRSFAGVPHRLEQVAEIDGVRFVNDSKATNVASAVGRPARLRGRRPRDPRRQREGRAVRAARSTRSASAAPPAT